MVDNPVIDDEAWSDTDESIASAGSTGNRETTGNLEAAWWNTEESVDLVTPTEDQVLGRDSTEAWSDTDESVNAVASTNDQNISGGQGPTSDIVPG